MAGSSKIEGADRRGPSTSSPPVDTRYWETEALAKLPRNMVKGLMAAFALQPDTTDVEPFWHMSLAAFGKSTGRYELEVIETAYSDSGDRVSCDVLLPFPIADFQPCFQLLQRLVKRGHEVKSHHVGDPRFDAVVLHVAP